MDHDQSTVHSRLLVFVQVLYDHHKLRGKGCGNISDQSYFYVIYMKKGRRKEHNNSSDIYALSIFFGGGEFVPEKFSVTLNKCHTHTFLEHETGIRHPHIC